MASGPISHPVDVALRFVEAINRQDLDALAALMAAEHTFIDLAGDVERGRERLRSGWAAYFALCPDYMVHVAEIYLRDSDVILRGRTTGSHLEQPRQVEIRDSLIWLARVAGEAVALWQLYEDTAETRHFLGLTPRHRFTSPL